MPKQYKTVINTYFSDDIQWIFAVSFIFIVAIISAIAVNDEDNKFLWLIPVLFAIIYSFSIPLLILYCKSKKDLKSNNIDRIAIKEFEINEDKKNNFRGRGGITGKTKYKIIDKNNNIYLISASNDRDILWNFYSHPTFLLEIEVLKNSRLVLQMRIVRNTKTVKKSHEKQPDIKHFKKTFKQYF